MKPLRTYPVHYVLTVIAFFLGGGYAFTQEKAQINWLSFEQLADSLQTAPKKVLISFHTDWCTYCRKMHREVFTKPEVIDELNTRYYAVKFDAETTDTVRFDGQIFVNTKATKRRKGFHDIALLLGSRNDQFTVPVTLILDEDFTVLGRHFEYIDSKKLLHLLQQ